MSSLRPEIFGAGNSPHFYDKAKMDLPAKISSRIFAAVTGASTLHVPFPTIKQISIPFRVPRGINASYRQGRKWCRNTNGDWASNSRGPGLSSRPSGVLVSDFYFYCATFSMKRWKMAATWARMALPSGVRVVLEVPVTRPWLTAQPMASRAYSEISA